MAQLDPSYSAIITREKCTVVTTRALVLTQDIKAPAGCFQVPETTDLEVFADEVTIRGRILAPEKTIRIFARTLKMERAQDPSGMQLAELNVDGRNGPPPASALAAPSEAARGENGFNDCIEPLPASGCTKRPGGNGQSAADPAHAGMHGKQGLHGSQGGSGGNIFVFCDSFPDGERLILSAKGGCGGDGQQGQNGAKGGDGGNGADAQGNAGFIGAGFVHSTGGGNGGKGGNAGPGGQGGTGGNGGQIIFRSVNEKNIPATSIATLATLGSKGSPGIPGNPGLPGKKGHGGRRAVRVTGGPGGEIPGSGDGKDGLRGSPALPGPKGTDGLEGKTDCSFQAKYSALKAGLPSASTGIDQTVFAYFQMIFERARASYLSSDYQRSQDLLSWINHTFPALSADSSDALQVRAFTTQVLAVKRNLALKRDYFGNAPDHVPVCSLAFYDGQLPRLLASLDVIEKRYADYRSSAREDQQKHSDFVAALGQTRALYDSLEQERQTTVLAIKEAVSEINASESQASAAKATLIEKMRDFSAQIQTAFSLPSVEQLAGILMNLSFMPEAAFGKAAMIGSQALMGGADLSQSAYKVTTDDGAEMDKRWVINRIDVFGKDLTELSAGYKVQQDFIQKDAGVYRILQKSEQFDELCNKFYNSEPRARETKACMDDYIRKISYRNAKIDEYNALWARLGELQGQLAKMNADKEEKAIELARMQDPGLPLRVAAFANLYNRVRDTTLKQLYLMSRAYSFWALKPYDDLTAVCKLFAPDSIDYATLTAARGQIQNDCAQQIETVYGSLRENSFPDERADLKKATGIIVSITDDNVIAALRSKGVARFEVPVNHPRFGGLANVRLKRVRAWIDGMSTSHNMHAVTITHCGPETMVATDGTTVTFQHDPVTVMFRYDASKGLENPKAIFEGRGGCVDGVVLADNYAPIGPFAHWRIALLKDGNEGLRLEDISRIVMEFHGIAQSLERNAIDEEGSGQDSTVGSAAGGAGRW